MSELSHERRRQVFLSYTREDREAAMRVATALRDAGLKAWVADWEINPGDNFLEKMERALSSTDLVLVLFSQKSVNSPWLTAELTFAQKLTDRAITVVPAMVEPCQLPAQFLNRQIIDLSQDMPRAAQRLADQLNVTVDVDFSQLSAQSFEALVADLLSELGLSVQRTSRMRDGGVDFLATHHVRDPFGTVKPETWFVETKFYKDQRVSVSTIRQMLGYLAVSPGASKGLIVTNGQLTSEARKFLAEANSRLGSELRAIDGTELKNLLLQQPSLTRRHFPQGADS